jgi:hypothetical protein
MCVEWNVWVSCLLKLPMIFYKLSLHHTCHVDLIWKLLMSAYKHVPPKLSLVHMIQVCHWKLPGG